MLAYIPYIEPEHKDDKMPRMDWSDVDRRLNNMNCCSPTTITYHSNNKMVVYNSRRHGIDLEAELRSQGYSWGVLPEPKTKEYIFRPHYFKRIDSEGNEVKRLTGFEEGYDKFQLALEVVECNEDDMYRVHINENTFELEYITPFKKEERAMRVDGKYQRWEVKYKIDDIPNDGTRKAIEHFIENKRWELYREKRHGIKYTLIQNDKELLEETNTFLKYENTPDVKLSLEELIEKDKAQKRMEIYFDWKEGQQLPETINNSFWYILKINILKFISKILGNRRNATHF